MIKVLAATDFSKNSEAAIKFAIQLAQQYPSTEVTFFHSYHILKPTSYSEAQFSNFEKQEVVKIESKLKEYVTDIANKIEVSLNGSYKFEIRESIIASSNIIEYAAKHNFDFIIVATRGAGKLEKLLGTNTANIINKSEVPVIAVPSDYENTNITSIIYSSDFQNVTKEVNKVSKFAQPINASLKVVHYAFDSDDITELESKKTQYITESKYPIDIEIEINKTLRPLVSSIRGTVKKYNPSILVMFTNQNRPFIEKLFFSGNTEDYALKTTVPLLVYKK